MNPRHRFVILRQGLPVHTATDLTGVVASLWGRDLRERYVVCDYERPVVVDTPDLLEWRQRHWPQEAEA